MSSSKAPIPKAAKPRFAPAFDPWNSSATGHQRPDNTPGTGWRDSRNKKLNGQFVAGQSGGERLSDTWGAGSPDWDDKMEVVVPQSLRRRKLAGESVVDMLLCPGKMKAAMARDAETEQTQPVTEREGPGRETEDASGKGGLFRGLVIYVNGSTFPLISDHKLKHLLAEQGAQMSMHLGRRKVTHVILGKPTGSALGVGAGGGLAGGKLEKEIKKLRGCGVKFVNVEWVLESLKVGKRLPEARFASTKMAPHAQGSVYSIYTKSSSSQHG